MIKKLLQEEKKEQQKQDGKNYYKMQLTLSSKSFFATVPSLSIVLTKMLYPSINDTKEIKIAKSVFRPPSFA